MLERWIQFKQFEGGEVGCRVVPRTKKDGVIFSMLGLHVMNVFKMGQSKTHDTVLTPVIGVTIQWRATRGFENFKPDWTEYDA